MKKNKKLIMSIFIVLGIVVLVSSATYAVFAWRSTYSLNVDISVTDTITIHFDGGPNVTGVLKPVYYPEEGIVKKIKVRSNLPNSGDTFNLYMKINDVPEELEDSLWWALVCADCYDFEGVNTMCTFESDCLTTEQIPVDQTTGDIVLLENQSIPYTGNLELNFYVWIDGTNINDPDIGGLSVDIDLYATGNTNGTLSERNYN